jgi:PAS domain S-box-containing protein
MLTKKIVNHVEELNTSQRGYTFTSKEIYQQPHLLAIQLLMADIDSLNALKKLRTNRPAQIDTAAQLLNEKINDSKNTIIIFDTAGINAVVEKIRSGVSKKINDSLSKALLQIEFDNEAVINNSYKYLEDTAKKTSYRFLVLSASFLAIVSSFLILIYFNFKRKEKIAAKLRYQASLIENLSDAIFTIDKNYVVETWNRHAAELYGVSVEEAKGKNLLNLMTFHSTDEDNVAAITELYEKGFYTNEYFITKKNNEKIYVLVSASTILNKEGKITGYIAVHRDITERKKLEESQKEFNWELKKQVKIKTAETTNIMERITDGFLALDSNFTFTFVNKKAGEMLGLDPEQMIGKNIFSGFGNISSTTFNEACLSAFKNQQYIFLENYYHPLKRWLENDIYPSADGLSVFFKDITVKKRTESALKESEERYKHLIENVHAAIVVHQPNGEILLYNQEAVRLLGISANEKIPNRIWYSVSADGGKLVQEEYPAFQVIKSGKPLIDVIAGINNPEKEGKTWVLMNAFPEFDNEKKLKQVVLTFVDITDAKRAEEELKRSEHDLNMAQAIARTGSWEFNLISQDLKWSKELYRIFELENTSEAELYEKYRQRFHPEDLPNLDSTIQRALENKRGYTYQHRIVLNNGVIKHILCIGEIVQDEAGSIISLKGTCQDITEMIKAEEKLQNSYKQIKQLVTHLQDIREQERTSMAREIHDELGQQLTGLKMYISSLNKKIAPKEDDIKEKFSSTFQLIEDTIKSVRKISMELRPSMLDDLGLMAALEWQSNEFEKRSGINTEFINETGNREIPNRLKTGLFRIYQESLTNVARHADAKKIVSSLKLKNNNLVLTITDNGKGFTFKNIESKKTLGLFGMKERTLEMGGHYEIKSEPGMGTTVSVTVPITD